MNKQPAGEDDVYNGQSHGAQQPFEGAHPRQGNADQSAQYDDSEQVINLRPLGVRQKALGQYIVDDSGMNLHIGIPEAEGCEQPILDAHGGGPDQHDLAGECPTRELAAENIADRKTGKGFRRAQVVNEQSTGFVGGDKPVSHLDPFRPVALNLNHQLRLAQVMPGTQDRQRRKEILAALYHERHPADDAVLINPQIEIA